jgi:hypothetical protein
MAGQAQMIGLDPMLGAAPGVRRDCLGCDLVEPLQPRIDLWGQPPLSSGHLQRVGSRLGRIASRRLTGLEPRCRQRSLQEDGGATFGENQRIRTSRARTEQSGPTLAVNRESEMTASARPKLAAILAETS